jgi:hypothetical protein
MKTMDGEALGQIEDKLRAIPSVLRYLIECQQPNHLSDFGLASGTFVTILAAHLYGK